LTFRRLAINGKFLTAGPTGVHRVAQQLMHQLERDDFAGLFKNPPTLMGPPNLQLGSFGSFNVERGGVFRGQLWEQLDLPRLTRPDLLLNLCNLGPMASTAAITMIHDAQVFVTPDSYRWGFVRWYRNILPVLGKRHARILTVSEFSADELARFGIARRDHISVVPNGVDHLLDHASQPQVLGRLALASRRFVVGLANVQPHKNIGLLLKAFAASELSGLKLVLVGAGGREEFERLRHVISPNVVFAGRITDGELRALLESALCTACPSTTEGFGLLPLEGMTFGCPAILAPCGALTEIAGNAAMFAAATDPRQWVHAIRSLVDEPARWAEYSQAGRARAALFTWRRAGQKLAEVIRETATRLLSERH
jgi:glycosyltransferase involved in cell wall biosynthesis